MFAHDSTVLLLNFQNITNHRIKLYYRFSLVFLTLLAPVALESRARKLIVIDTDPGIDDASAILMVLGAEDVKVLGITTVRGNAGEPDVAANVLKLLAVANRRDIPVFAGADFNLIDSPSFDNWFGPDGFWNVSIPNPPPLDSVSRTHSATFLANIVKERPGQVTILAIGPLTNIALAIHLNPRFLQQAKRIIILGGSIRGNGNVAPGLEFNFYLDPDAASFVLQKALLDGVQLTLVPMETVVDGDLGTEWRLKELSGINNAAFRYLDKLERTQHAKRPLVYANSYHPYDVYAAAVFLSKATVVQTEQLYGFVENRSDKRSRGVLVVDHSNVTKRPANLDVVTTVNVSEIRQLMKTNLGAL